MEYLRNAQNVFKMGRKMKQRRNERIRSNSTKA